MSRNPYRAFHPVFDWKHTPAQIDWSDLYTSKKLSTASSAKVTAELAAGRNYGKMHGISKKSDDRLANNHHGGAVAPTGNVDRSAGSTTEKLRAALKAGGAMTNAELAAVTRVPADKVLQLLKYDRKRGRIDQIGSERPHRYQLVESVSTEALA